MPCGVSDREPARERHPVFVGWVKPTEIGAIPGGFHPPYRILRQTPERQRSHHQWYCQMAQNASQNRLRKASASCTHYGTHEIDLRVCSLSPLLSPRMGAEARSQGREPLDEGSSSDPGSPGGATESLWLWGLLSPLPGLERRLRGSRSIIQGLTPLATSGRPSGALGTDSQRKTPGGSPSMGLSRASSRPLANRATRNAGLTVSFRSSPAQPHSHQTLTLSSIRDRPIRSARTARIGRPMEIAQLTARRRLARAASACSTAAAGCRRA